MSRLLIVRGHHSSGRSSGSEDLPAGVEVVADPEKAIARLGNGVEEIRWIALAPDLDDPLGIAQRIRAADPDVGIVWLPRDPTAWAELPGLLAPAPAGDETLLADVAADIAHQVGTPMTAILGYAEMLQKSASDEKSSRRATRIVEQVHRVSGLLEKLLEASRRPPGGPGRPRSGS
jgi:signal transduction histidine kinase